MSDAPERREPRLVGGQIMVAVSPEGGYVTWDDYEALRKENERMRGMLKAEAIGALWVCPDCDIARCKHYRAALQGETG